jgi:hypothetical protein
MDDRDRVSSAGATMDPSYRPLDWCWCARLCSRPCSVHAVWALSSLGFLTHGISGLGGDYLRFQSALCVPCSVGMSGLSDGVRLLASQALGAGNTPLVSLWFQVGLLLVTLACLPVVGMGSLVP